MRHVHAPSIWPNAVLAGGLVLVVFLIVMGSCLPEAR